MAEAIAVLAAQGAVIVDPTDIPSVVATDPKANTLLWELCRGLDNAKGQDAHCSVVFKYGMKRDFSAWLSSLGPKAPVKTLTELRQWNVAHQKAGAIKYGQAQLDISDEMDVLADRTRYEADRAKDVALAGAQGIDAAMERHNLDALLFPGPSGFGIAAKPGYPTVIVPFGFVPNAPPAAPAAPLPSPTASTRNRPPTGSASRAAPAASPGCWPWRMRSSRPPGDACPLRCSPEHRFHGGRPRQAAACDAGSDGGTRAATVRRGRLHGPSLGPVGGRPPTCPRGAHGVSVPRREPA